MIDPHPALTDEDGKPRALALWNFHEDRSLPNILPEEFANRVQAVINQDPSLFGMEERALKKRIFHEHDNTGISPTLNRLRMKFWVEYDRAQSEQTLMHLPLVFAGVCFQEQFYSMMQNRWSLAWVLCAPANYLVTMEEGLQFGIEELRDVLSLPTVTSKGATNNGLINAKIQIVQMLENRLKGAVTQKIERTSKSVNVNVNEPVANPRIAAMVAGMSLDEMKGQLEDLRNRKRISESPNPLAMPQNDESDAE